ncbi:MAG TPA: NADPH-dependent F420 reductase [Bryobacteraceae bacterium]|nr:NADPH-dependent F420 reductase [Bryobacteraceae bacterium]
MILAIVGGTGAEGRGLAARFAKAGVQVRIGSRNAEKAQEAARRIGENTSGHANADAVAGADIAILTVPLSAQVETLKSIKGSLGSGTILVDATVPLEVAIGGRVSRMLMLWDGSAAQQAARLLPGVPVVAAFHALSAEALAELEYPLDCDGLLCGDNAEAKAKVAQLAQLIPGVRAIDAGTLDNARLLESAAALLISLNLRHKVNKSGMRITGL